MHVNEKKTEAMTFDIDRISSVYAAMPQRIAQIRQVAGRPLTLTEKILYSHLAGDLPQHLYERGEHYVNFAPDRVAMQDATAQMALLQFMNSGRERTMVPTTVHCDHLIQAHVGARADLDTAMEQNSEVYDFLASASARYGIGFWKPGAGIIHQVVLENYAFPGGVMIGTDSHTVNAGGLGMVAIGVGGADAVDVMAGMPWELKMPRLIGVKLTGKLSGWTSAKDVILKIAGILTVKGGTGYILEYFGDGAGTLSATGKGTICNMGAEIGATTSLFGYDESMARYLRHTGRTDVAQQADAIAEHLRADVEVTQHPTAYYDQLIEIDLNTLEPYINGPFTPDAAWPLSAFAQAVRDHDYPAKLEVGLIGSCTNSSYEDLSRAASVARQARTKKLKVHSRFLITPGSEQIRYTVARDGLLKDFEDIGGVVMANACGPCIGQWKRDEREPEKKNSILNSFNRNFAKRNDGNPNTHSFVASPEVVTALTIAGDLTFNPMTDTLINEEGDAVMLDEPRGVELPAGGFEVKEAGFVAPPQQGTPVEVTVARDSKRLQLLEPFEPWNGHDLEDMLLLIKVRGKCTTDHISMAGPWLRYRGHLDNISDNLLMGAVNAFNGLTNHVKNQTTHEHEYDKVAKVARLYCRLNLNSIIVGDENYGEGSSREHAAMEPRHLGVLAVVARSFARIHETNLKKQGVLALTFAKKEDYKKVQEDDRISITGMDQFRPGQPLTMVLDHRDETVDVIQVLHTYNDAQIAWFKAGGALNLIREKNRLKQPHM